MKSVHLIVLVSVSVSACTPTDCTSWTWTMGDYRRPNYLGSHLPLK